MKSQTILIIIIVTFGAIIGVLFWLFFARDESRESLLDDRFIYEPHTLDIEQDSTYYPLGTKVPKKLKTLIITYYPSEVGLSTYKEIFHYDKSGKIIKRSVYRNGSLGGEWVFEYDDKGNRICDIYRGGFPKVVYQYDEKDNRIGWIYYGSNGKLVSQGILKYDKKNRLVEKVCWNAAGRRRLYRYSYHNDLLTQCLYYDPPNKLYKKRIYIYNKEERIIEWLDWYSGNNWAYADERAVYFYDNEGNLIEETLYYSGGYFNRRTIYLYDDKGNKIEERVFNSDKPGSGYFGRIFQYNEQGYLVKSFFYIVSIHPETKKEHRSEGAPIVYDYEFYSD